MVKILSNGDIVPDDDPRAQSASSRGNRADNTNRPRQVITSIAQVFYVKTTDQIG